MKSKGKKIFTTVIISVLVILVLAVLYFLQFTSEGYFITIPYRASFKEIAHNVYVNKDYGGDTVEILDLIEQAKERDKEFFGELTGLDDNVIVISDDEKIYSKLGDKITHTLLFPKKREYISISKEFLNIDILSHELTHAEFHSHFTSASSQKMIPPWFDEGVATQNDYREQYSYEQWVEKTDNGKNAFPLEDMDSPREFYSGDNDEKRLKYTCAKHEVAEWLTTHSPQDIIRLAERVDNGEDFYTVYDR